jgi:surface carbohydrate biosynthesis protein (TIGR04326 family)
LNKLLKIEIIEVNDTWEKLFSNCDFVYTSNVTTAAIDAYSVGLKVITLVNGNSFNMSPLINYKEVIFVTNSDEFRDAIEINNSSNTDLPKSYFNINSSLTLWNNLITKVSE